MNVPTMSSESHWCGLYISILLSLSPPPPFQSIYTSYSYSAAYCCCKSVMAGGVDKTLHGAIWLVSMPALKRHICVDLPPSIAIAIAAFSSSSLMLSLSLLCLLLPFVAQCSWLGRPLPLLLWWLKIDFVWCCSPAQQLFLVGLACELSFSDAGRCLFSKIAGHRNFSLFYTVQMKSSMLDLEI